MIKKPLIGLTTPQIEYQPLPPALQQPVTVPLPDQVTLLAPKSPGRPMATELKSGDRVKTGQRLVFSEDGKDYVIASVTGTIVSLTRHAGDYGKTYTRVVIKTDSQEEFDDGFAPLSETPSSQAAADFLMGAPGAPPLATLLNPDTNIETVIVYGGDTDLLITTNQYIVRTDLEGVTSGINILKEITGIKNIILAMPGESMQGYGHIGAVVKNLDMTYPAALPPLVMEAVLGQILPAGKRPEDLGVCFMTVEAVVSLGKAFTSGKLPVTKTLTVINKQGETTLATARMGTPIGALLETSQITIENKDRIIIGGPMTGSTIYDEQLPIGPDTNAVMVQAWESIPHVSDYPCINCGECLRVCPVNIPVNMLVRFLEVDQYEEGAEQYDLLACVECGLCSYVCTAKIPIFQYIRLGKYELERIRAAEAANDE